jgi:hypothetical protein
LFIAAVSLNNVKTSITNRLIVDKKIKYTALLMTNIWITTDNGGGNGIRTHDPDLIQGNRLAGGRTRPLCDPSLFNKPNHPGKYIIKIIMV